MSKNWIAIAGTILASLSVGLDELEAQITIYEVVRSEDNVPGSPGVTFDGPFGTAVVNGRDEVIVVAGRRFNRATINHVAAKWTPASLDVVLQYLSEPLELPLPWPNFLNADDDPFEMPRAGSITGLRAGQDGSYYLAVRYEDFGDIGVAPRAWVKGTRNNGNLFYSISGLGSTSRGVAPLIGATMLNGGVGSGADITNLAGRRTYDGVVEPVIIEGQQAPLQADGVTFALVAGANMKWSPGGQIAHLGTVAGPGIDFSNSTVLHFESTGLSGLLPVAQAGCEHPVVDELADGGRFSSFRFTGINDFTINTRGDLAFASFITDPDDPGGEVGSLWSVEPDGEEIFILRGGKTLATVNAGSVNFTSISTPLLAENGDIVFRADWRDPGFRSGLFRWIRADGTLRLELGNDGPVDGTIGDLTVEFFGHFLINSAGRIAAKVGLNVPGEDGGLKDAIIVQRAAGNFYALVVEGRSVNRSNGGATSLVTDLDFPLFTTFTNGADGARVAFSKNGRLILPLELDHTNKEILVAADIDPGPARPAPPEGVPAGRTQSWEKPERYQDAMKKERTRIEQALATAQDENVPVDLASLTGLMARDITKLRTITKFSGEPRESVIAFLQAQLNILKSIDLILLEDPQVGVWLLESFRAQRIQFGTDARTEPYSFAEINPDSSAQCGREVITLRFVPSGDLPIYDPNFFQLTNSLLREGRHAFRSFPILPEPHTALQQAQWALDRHCIGIEAACEEIERVENLIESIQFNPSTPFEKRIIAELFQDLAGIELSSAIDRLLSRNRKILRNAQEEKRCREEYKKALGWFLMTAGTAQDGEKLKSDLAQLNWFIEFKKENNEYGEIGVSCGGATFNLATGTVEGNSTIRQFDPENDEETSFDIGAEHIFDGALKVDGSKFYASAKVDLNGVIYSYSDFDGDGRLDQSTQQEVASDPELASGAFLTIDERYNRLYAVNPTTGYGLSVDLNLNLPMPMGRFGLGPDPMVDMEINDGFLQASPVPEGSAITPELRKRIAAIKQDGTLGDSKDDLALAAKGLAALFESAPAEGDDSVSVSGQPGSRAQLCRWNLDMLTNAGTITLDAEGKGTIPVSPPLTSQDTVQLVTPNNYYSLRLPVWKTEDFNLNMTVLPKTLAVEVIGDPRKTYQQESSRDMRSWMDRGSFRPGGFGTHVSPILINEGDEERFFRRFFERIDLE